MQCQESKKILDAYVDNEVDLMQSVALEEHLAGCADCSQTLESRRALRDSIHNADLRYAAPPELLKSVRKSLRMPEEKTASPKWQWFRMASLGFASATAVCALIVAIAWFALHTPEDQKMAQQVADNYIRSMMMENRGVDVVSSDMHTVKPWFVPRLSFSPQVANFADKGFPLAGGRLDYLNNQTVATLIYKHNQHFIDVFQYPSISSSGLKERQERGYNIIGWAKNGMQCWVVSELNLSELQQFVELMKSGN